MKTGVFGIILLLGIWPCAFGQDADKKPVAEPSGVRANKKLQREILGMENQLKTALDKRDIAALDLILADYYVDTFEGGNSAISKKGTIARCKDGQAPYYAVNGERKITVKSGVVVVEGISSFSSESAPTDLKKPIRVKRNWTKKDGRWQLVSQTKVLTEEEAEK